jgi:hypothetical protein
LPIFAGEDARETIRALKEGKTKTGFCLIVVGGERHAV